jgi:hypothetical protein
MAPLYGLTQGLATGNTECVRPKARCLGRRREAIHRAEDRYSRETCSTESLLVLKSSLHRIRLNGPSNALFNHSAASCWAS